MAFIGFITISFSSCSQWESDIEDPDIGHTGGNTTSTTSSIRSLSDQNNTSQSKDNPRVKSRARDIGQTAGGDTNPPALSIM